MIKVHRYISTLKLSDKLMELWQEAQAEKRQDILHVIQKYVIPAINATPSEDVIYKRSGHWNLRIDKEKGLYIECSECGRKQYISEEEAVEYLQLCEAYPHCHCGAFMDPAGK